MNRRRRQQQDASTGVHDWTQKAPEYMDRISVSLEDATAYNLLQRDWTREKFLEALKTHTWIKVGKLCLVQIARITSVRFFPKETDQYATTANCSEFEFA